MPKYCLNFIHPSSTSLSISGGKGCNLAKLKQAGFEVPPGFILSTSAFSEFLVENELDKPIYKELRSLRSIDPDQIKNTSEKILNLLAKSKIPLNIEIAVKNMLTQLHFQRVAVRSSATAEDLPFASFAGQQDSFLNVTSEADILANIKRCWASLFNERSITYRLQNKIDHAAVLMAVCIQEMVPSDLSGILFTADPISNHHRHLVINAGFGLGEGLVMGWVNPDQIVVDKSDHKIISYEIGDKKKRVNLEEAGGTSIAEVLPESVNQPALSFDQINRLTQMGVQVESIYNQPQDIEWAISSDHIYLLQSRPITSLYPIPSPAPNDNDLHIYFSVGHAQMITDPISPMGISILRLILPFGRSPRKVGNALYLKQAGGRLYADITPILNTKRGKEYVPTILKIAEPLAAIQLKYFVNSEEFVNRNSNSNHKIKSRVLVDWIAPLVIRTFSWLFFRNPENVSGRTIDHGQEYLVGLSEKLSKAGMDQKLAMIKESTGDLFHKYLIWMMDMVAAGQLSRVLVERLLKERKTEINPQALQSGLEGNITTEMDLMVGDLADLVAQESGLQEIIQAITENKFAYSTELFDKYPLFKKTWINYIQRFGMRCVGELDISRPRWADAPQTLFQTILAKIKTSEPGSHRQHYQNLKERNFRLQQEIVSAFRSSLKGRLQLPTVKRFLKVAVNLMPIREHPKYIISGYLKILRDQIQLTFQALLSNGVSLPDDGVWYLSFDELQDLVSNPSLDYSQIVAERQMLYQHYKKLTPPRVITSEGEISHHSLSREGFAANAIVGSSVSAGIVEGIARVILDPSQEQLNRGEILVAPFTDPGWTPLFINAAGIALETGGLMTHGSVIAREYGIPAVVGIVDITKTIKTGMLIKVNGDQGYIEIIRDTDNNPA
jgi:pyruvate,water dikinase